MKRKEDHSYEESDRSDMLHGNSGFLLPQDRDGDGVTDNEDKCPDDYGHRLNQGCPLGNPDSDEDGVCDAWVAEKGFEAEFSDVCEGVDECPNEPGEGEDGCELDDPDPALTIRVCIFRADLAIPFIYYTIQVICYDIIKAYEETIRQKTEKTCLYRRSVDLGSASDCGRSGALSETP